MSKISHSRFPRKDEARTDPIGNTNNSQLRHIIGSLAGYVFSVNKEAVDDCNLSYERMRFDYVTNLPFQMMVYFNCFFTPFWAASVTAVTVNKIPYMGRIHKVLNVASLILYSIIQGPRLYFAFTGNLMEQVPELVGFWLLTILIQIPTILFLLLDEGMKASPFERVLHLIEFIFVALEAIVGFFVIKLMVRNQAIKFQVYMQSKKLDKSALPERVL
ncbi:unnamed protein product [Dicrocoelium dendriticum]|nr:unnamed protein product [Dicrocoelium dendriticum]